MIRILTQYDSKETLNGQKLFVGLVKLCGTNYLSCNYYTVSGKKRPP